MLLHFAILLISLDSWRAYSLYEGHEEHPLGVGRVWRAWNVCEKHKVRLKAWKMWHFGRVWRALPVCVSVEGMKCLRFTWVYLVDMGDCGGHREYFDGEGCVLR